MTRTFVGPDKKSRCSWCAVTAQYIDYHDKEWGYPVVDDFRLFEKISLEGFQSGLSWRTILTKREHFRSAFKHFDYNHIARFSSRDVERLMKDEGIVRHRGKIEAVVNNARRAQELVKKEGSLAAFVWQYEASHPSDEEHPRSTSEESIALSKELKRLGWMFVGPTTCYAFMQAMGLVNDHVRDCVSWAQVERAKKRFKRPVRLGS